MVFTERQKTELVCIVKAVSQKIIEIFNDKKFMESIAAKVADMVAQKIDERMQIFEARISELENKLHSVQVEKDELFCKTDNMEQVLKLNQLCLHGLPEEENELNNCVSEIIKKRLDLPNIEVEQCYRIGKHPID